LCRLLPSKDAILEAFRYTAPAQEICAANDMSKRGYLHRQTRNVLQITIALKVLHLWWMKPERSGWLARRSMPASIVSAAEAAAMFTAAAIAAALHGAPACEPLPASLVRVLRHVLDDLAHVEGFEAWQQLNGAATEL